MLYSATVTRRTMEQGTSDVDSMMNVCAPGWQFDLLSSYQPVACNCICIIDRTCLSALSALSVLSSVSSLRPSSLWRLSTRRNLELSPLRSSSISTFVRPCHPRRALQNIPTHTASSHKSVNKEGRVSASTPDKLNDTTRHASCCRLRHRVAQRAQAHLARSR